jgi:glycosyltransferase involved in cell wall biosynthesis
MINQNEQVPEISVIIIAYNRKDYLIQAVQSTINQQFDREKYEIIAVKNFTDPDTDHFLNVNGVKNIFSSNISIGSKFTEGIRSARGEIICLLEDDDIFLPNKLDVVYSVFLRNPNLCYYHNNAGFIDGSGNIMNNFDTVSTRKIKRVGEMYVKADEKDKKVFRLFDIGSYWNNSCICIRKSFYTKYMDTLSKIKTIFDGAIFFAALYSDGDVLISSEILTYYRINSLSATQSAKLDPFSHFNTSVKNIDDNLVISQMLEKEIMGKSRIFQRVIIDRTYWEIKSIIYNESSNRAEAIKYLYRMLTKGEITFESIRSNLLQLSGLLLFIISPKLSRKSRIA